MKHRGFTLLEALIAAGILVVAATGLLTLGIAGTTATRQILQEQRARFLGREALEAVRVVRDNNWDRALSDDASVEWTEGLAALAPTDHTAIVLLDNPTAPPMEWLAFDGCDTVTESCATVWEMDGRLVQQFGTPPDAVDTGFHRLLTLDPICRDTNGEETILSTGGCADREEEQVGLNVRATVTWEQGQQSVEERLYNWYPSL